MNHNGVCSAAPWSAKRINHWTILKCPLHGEIMGVWNEVRENVYVKVSLEYITFCKVLSIFCAKNANWNYFENTSQ